MRYRYSFYSAASIHQSFYTSLVFAYRRHAVITPTHQQFLDLCENKFARFAENPFVTNYILLQRDPKTTNIALAMEFSFDDIVKQTGWISQIESHQHEAVDKDAWICVPTVSSSIQLKGFEDSKGDIVLHGQTKYGLNMVGRPLCDIEVTHTHGPSQQYLFYSMSPDNRLSASMRIPRLQNSPDARQLRMEKGGRYKASDDLIIHNKEVLKRNAIKKRTPDQNEVMDLRAVDEYRACANEYGKYFHPALTAILYYSAAIMHLSTLRAKQKRKEVISEEEKNIAHRDRLLRTEWLHLLSYGLHSMNKNPQCPENLGAARACDNTRMMLLEYAIKWFALHVPSSRSRISGRFDLLLDTDVIDTITLLMMLSVNGVQCKLMQKIDALAVNPEHIHASDLAGLITILTFLIQNVRPYSQQLIKIMPSSPMIWQSNTRFSRDLLTDTMTTHERLK